ncbi:MAG: Rap1a/Tai family immunity protein [Thiohalocapsa sp.]
MRVSLSITSSLIAGVLGLGLSATPFAAQDEDFNFDTTEDLYQVCSTSSDNPEHIPAVFACRAFIEATMQYHDAVSDRKRMKRLVCYSDTATIGDGRRAFLSWAEANSGNKTLMGELPVVGLVRALAAKYPCK